MFSSLLNIYLLPLCTAAALLLLGFGALALLARAGRAKWLWNSIVRLRWMVMLLGGAVLLVVALLTLYNHAQRAQNLQLAEERDLTSKSNLVANPLFTPAGINKTVPATWLISGTVSVALVTTATVSPGGTLQGRQEAQEVPGVYAADLRPNASLTSQMIAVRAGSTYRYSLYLYQHPQGAGSTNGTAAGRAQVRLLWLNTALQVISWDDSLAFTVPAAPSQVSGDWHDPSSFHEQSFDAPQGASRMQFELRNVGNGEVWATSPKVSQDGVYIEQLPNGTEGALAFSFDWESAMGGPIHSRGMEVHNSASAVQHGMLMRQGADWLNQLFITNHISATFYATGYNLLDGNTAKTSFAGNPTYSWASQKNGWASDYWLTHPWYSDDPFGTWQSDSAWYFGDQTRALLAAGHEIATHTFGHLYVRGTTPAQLSADLDQWLRAAQGAGVPPPTTFAFPWRSSNSLTVDFYDVLHNHGIDAVTRLYGPDLKDMYTLSAPLTYTDVHQPALYGGLSVMPDFLLGTASNNQAEEAGGSGMSLSQGLQVISETLARRGTTSFWNHPEQLGDDPSLSGVRQTWQGVVQGAVQERDRGHLWIDTVAGITTYERDVLSVTATLDQGFLTSGGWSIHVTNDSGKDISGVTLTLPGDAIQASSSSPGVTLQGAYTRGGTTKLVPVTTAGSLSPTRQLVLEHLAQGSIDIAVEWVPGLQPIP